MSSHRRESPSDDEELDDFMSVLNSCVVDTPTDENPEPDQETLARTSMEEFDRSCDVFGGWTDFVYGPREENHNGRQEQAIAPSPSLPFATPRSISAPPTEAPGPIPGASPAIQQRRHFIPSCPSGRELGSFSPHPFLGTGSQQHSAQAYQPSPLLTITSAYSSFRASGHYWHQVPANVPPSRSFATANPYVGQGIASNMHANQEPTRMLGTGAYPVGSLQAGQRTVPKIHGAQPSTGPTNSAPYHPYIPTWQVTEEFVYARSFILQGNGRAQAVSAGEPILPYPSQAFFTREQTNRVQAGANAAYTLAQSQNQSGRRLPAFAPNPNPGTVQMPVPSSAPQLHLPLDQRRVPDFVELLQADLIQVDPLRLPQYNWINQTMPQFTEHAMANVRRAWQILAQLGTSRVERAAQHEYLYRLTAFIRQSEQDRERQVWLRQQLPHIWNLMQHRARSQQGSERWVAMDTQISQIRDGLTEMERNTVRHYVHERVQELRERWRREQQQRQQQWQDRSQRSG